MRSLSAVFLLFAIYFGNALSVKVNIIVIWNSFIHFLNIISVGRDNFV